MHNCGHFGVKLRQNGATGPSEGASAASQGALLESCSSISTILWVEGHLPLLNMTTAV